MNENNLITKIKSLHTLTPKAEVFSVIEKQVFSVVDNTYTGSIPTSNKKGFSGLFISWNQLTTIVVACSLLIVISSQVPHHSAYQRSITSLAETQRLTESLEHDLTQLEATDNSLSQTRASFNALSLKGTLGLYTQNQCLEAYTLYDAYLDYTLQTVDAKLKNADNSESKKSLEAFKEKLISYQAEARTRIEMYPNQH
jgi:hypothetical protein